MQCLANLRTIGQALQIYAGSFDGFLPYGSYVPKGNTYSPTDDTYDWTVRVAGIMTPGDASMNFYGTGLNKKFLICPSANQDFDPGQQYISQYSCRPRMMPAYDARTGFIDPATGLPPAPYRLAKVLHASDIILILDGSQQLSTTGNGGDASAVASGIVSSSVYGYTYSSMLIWPVATICPSYAQYFYSQPFYGGPNTNGNDPYYSYSASAQIRWRHGSNNAATFLFCDGHAGT